MWRSVRSEEVVVVVGCVRTIASELGENVSVPPLLPDCCLPPAIQEGQPIDYFRNIKSREFGQKPKAEVQGCNLGLHRITLATPPLVNDECCYAQGPGWSGCFCDILVDRTRRITHDCSRTSTRSGFSTLEVQMTLRTDKVLHAFPCDVHEVVRARSSRY